MSKIKVGDTYILRTTGFITGMSRIWTSSSFWDSVYTYIKRYRPSNVKINKYDGGYSEIIIYSTPTYDLCRWKVRYLSPLIISNENEEIRVLPISAGAFLKQMKCIPSIGDKVKIIQSGCAIHHLFFENFGVEYGKKIVNYINLYNPINVHFSTYARQFVIKSAIDNDSWVVKEKCAVGTNRLLYILGNKTNEMAVVSEFGIEIID